MATSFDPGTEAAPGLYVTGDSDTGLSSPNADRLSMSVGGKECAHFKRGAIWLHSGDDATESILALNFRNQHVQQDIVAGRLVVCRFEGLTDQNDVRTYAMLRAYSDDANGSTLKGRFEIVLNDGPDHGDQTSILDAYVTHANAGVPYRYTGSIEPSDLTNSKDLASVEKVEALIAAGVGAPFPIHVPLLGSVDNGTYPLVSKVQKPFKMNGITLKSGGGSATVAVQKNGGVVSGLTSLAVTTTASDHTPTGDSTEDFPVGSALSIVISSASSLSNLTVDIDAELAD